MLSLLDPKTRREACNAYLGARKGSYDNRAVRYRAALAQLQLHGLQDTDTVLDLGAGWTEFDYTLRVDGNSRARYWPVDGGLDGTNIEHFKPREVEFTVALEILEHLNRSALNWIVPALKANTTKAMIVSVPNPETTDVLGMDPTHVTVVTRKMLHDWNFKVHARKFYGKHDDSLFAVWTPEGK